MEEAREEQKKQPEETAGTAEGLTADGGKPGSEEASLKEDETAVPSPEKEQPSAEETPPAPEEPPSPKEAPVGASEEKTEERPPEAEKKEAEKSSAPPAEAAKPEEKIVVYKKERPANCEECDKPLGKRGWYYRNGKYFCKKKCWKSYEIKSKAEGESAEG